MTKTTEAKWRAVIRDQERSGLAVREFAQSRGISAGTLFWWRSRLRRASSEQPDLVPVQVLDDVPDPDGSMIELQVRDILVRLPAGFAEADLRRILTVLGQPC